MAAEPDFARAIALHRRASLFQGALAALLVVLGIGLLLAGLLAGWLPAFPASALGLLALSLVALPLAGLLERRERIEGLEVLAGEWREADEAEARDGIVALVGSMYRAGAGA